METENRYKKLSEMKEDCVLPPECKEGVLTMMVAHNIGRNEKTVSGEFSQNMKGKRFNTFAAVDITHFQ